MIRHAALLCFVLAVPAQALDAGQVRAWREDLAVYRKQLEARHINLYHHTDKARFHAALEQLSAQLPSLNEQQVTVELMRITRMVGDGHTQFAPWDNAFRRYPIGFKLIDGELRVMRAGPGQQALLGTRLVAIDGTPVATVRSRLAPVVQSVENDQSLQRHLGAQAALADVLFGLGIARHPAQARFELESDGKQTYSVALTAVAFRDFAKAAPLELQPLRVPFDRKAVEENDHLWLSMDANRRMAYLYFAHYPSPDDMDSFARKVRAALQKHGIRKLVIDLRDNSGGDFFVGLRLAHQLVLVDSLDWEGGIYTLIGPATFSAGMSNAAQFRQIFNARLVGEPTGANPVGYQDMDSFTLPNSQRKINYSKRFYRFQDQAAPGLQPDVLVRTTWADMRRQVDAPLEWVLADATKR